MASIYDAMFCICKISKSCKCFGDLRCLGGTLPEEVAGLPLSSITITFSTVCSVIFACDIFFEVLSFSFLTVLLPLCRRWIQPGKHPSQPPSAT
jgi:hypothetical protein